MKCFPRFVREHKECFGDYGFDRAFWPGRQLSMLLFRLGALEFELIPETKTDDEVPEKEAVRAFHLPVKEIGVHIPSDADISPARVQISFMFANMFFAKYVLCKACATGCRVPLYVRVVDDESGTAEAASANEPDSAVPEAFYDNTLGKRLGGGLLAVGIQGGEGLSA